MTLHDDLAGRTKHRLTVEEFLLLDREGAFGDRRAELFDGEVYYMSPKHRPHARILGDMYYSIRQALEQSGSHLSVLADISVHLSDHHAPEPDLAITDAPEGEGMLPLQSIRLLVEVADSTLPQDMRLKAPLYASAGLPEYWVVDVTGGVTHQMWSPRDGSYAERREVPLGEAIAAATIDGLVVQTPH